MGALAAADVAAAESRVQGVPEEAAEKVAEAGQEAVADDGKLAWSGVVAEALNGMVQHWGTTWGALLTESLAGFVLGAGVAQVLQAGE